MSSFTERRKKITSFKKLREYNVRMKNSVDEVAELFDRGSFHQIYDTIESVDPLNFPGYKKKLKEARKKTELSDAVIAGYGKIDGMTLFTATLDSDFMMGSLGSAVGEILTRTIEAADRRHCPLVIFSASGGARMQEGLFGLMQMAKTSAAIERFKQHGGLYISVLMHPTTGGVSASFASLGDIILAEPNALIGFAGPRVIEQTIGEKLPQGFQRSEFQLEHGFVDQIVEPERMRDVLAQILRLHHPSFSGHGKERRS